jgi:hypothetical protein
MAELICWGGAHVSVASLYVKAYGARVGHPPRAPKSVPRQPDRRYGDRLWLVQGDLFAAIARMCV